MRMSFVLLSVAVGLVTALGALMLLLPAPHMYFFMLGVGALEWAPLVILSGIICTLLALLGVRSPTSLLRGLGWAGLALNIWTILVTSGVLIAALRRPLAVRSTMPAVVAGGAGAFSLATFVGGDTSSAGAGLREGVVYATVDNQPLLMDIHTPPRDQPGTAAAVVVIHGGSWRSGTRGELAAASKALAGSRYVVFDVDYRLAPGKPFPAAISDVKCAIGHIKANAASYGIDPQKIILLGRSAGGQIALLTAYTPNDPELAPSCPAPDTSVAGVIAYYPPTDLVYDYNNRIHPELTVGALDQYLGGSPEQVPDAYRLAVPLDRVGPDTPPTLLIHGERDQFVRLRDSQVLADKLEAAGLPFTLLELPWANHGFDANFKGPSHQRVFPYVKRFLASVAGY